MAIPYIKTQNIAWIFQSIPQFSLIQINKSQIKYPNDTEAGTLFSESVMDLHPWDYWSKDGTPQPWTNEILSNLEKVLKLNPEHPGANHLFIHAVEASKSPERGLENADRLRTLIPGAGHLVHMPSHIYIRVGKYHEGTLANQMAVFVHPASILTMRFYLRYPCIF